MAEYQPDKFIVINRKHISNIESANGKNAVQTCIDNLLYILDWEKFPNHKYYVCNQDEPYAQKVLDVILEGEREKELTPCQSCKKPRGEDGQGALIIPCPHCGDELPF